MQLHFFRFHVNRQFCHFLGEKCGDEIFIYFGELTIESRNIELFCNQF
jgi:hypothetical protein